MPEYKTQNEIRAERWAKLLGITEQPTNCMNCHWYKKISDFRGECTIPLAKAIHGLYDSGVPIELPAFPLIEYNSEETGTLKLPSIVASEFGINNGFMRWPVEFDPIYILLCIMFATEQEYLDQQTSIGKEKSENEPIDKSNDSVV